MAQCDDGEPREQPQIDGVGDDWIDEHDPGLSTLIEYRGEKHELTARHELDVHSAITAGLANYLLTLDGAIAGRSCALRSVVADWSEHSVGARGLPSAAVLITDEVEYARDSGLGIGRGMVVGELGGEKLTVLETGLFETEMLRVDVMCPDKELRRGVRRMLALGLAPVPWMVGFRLVLPTHHGAIATFLLRAAAFPDSEVTAQQSLWPIRLRLRVSCPEYRLHGLPLARPIVSGTIT